MRSQKNSAINAATWSQIFASIKFLARCPLQKQLISEGRLVMSDINEKAAAKDGEENTFAFLLLTAAEEEK